MTGRCGHDLANATYEELPINGDPEQIREDTVYRYKCVFVYHHPS
ncbi:hypothetical protein QR46_3489 [Giardia duodenalis assemblage B]|uniref:Uncharacterized protein n=2 Tax=Giardia intestinalis TaxID=5741 RepID=A0A132NS35_GIAIN|nr:Hypothetical protein GSB_153663 [Giardia intestinalis]KWX12532.1 hypothetical protein QR46_3489 [Giardia intestinalis assemblage B]